MPTTTESSSMLKANSPPLPIRLATDAFPKHYANTSTVEGLTHVAEDPVSGDSESIDDGLGTMATKSRGKRLAKDDVGGDPKWSK